MFTPSENHIQLSKAEAVKLLYSWCREEMGKGRLSAGVSASLRASHRELVPRGELGADGLTRGCLSVPGENRVSAPELVRSADGELPALCWALLRD